MPSAGVPVQSDAPAVGPNIRFATLMRVLCMRNSGAFVGLNEPSSYKR